MPCPFLSKLSPNYVRSYASTLLKNYGNHCPIMSRTLNSLEDIQLKDKENSDKKKNSKCPFLSELDKVMIKEVTEDDTIDIGLKNNAFPYESFFHDQILRKKKDHSYRVFKKVNRLGGQGQFPRAKEYSWGEKNITVWCSNDYLGMSCHPKVKEAVCNAVENFGVGAGGTRNISGNSIYHEKLEKAIAKLHKKEAALLFTSCFVANDSTLFTLAKAIPGCHIFSDEGNHASMIQGIRNSRVPKHIFKHNNPNHLEELLQRVDTATPKIVVFETVHSMSGAVCPLQEMCEVAQKYGALTFVDEVHAVGLYGHNGAGIGERDNQLHNMDIISGTLGKAFGNIGGYIAGSSTLIDMVRSYAAGFIFTTSLPPTVLHGSLKALEILSSDEGRILREKHQKNVSYLRRSLLEHGFPVENTPSHIIPIKVGDPFQCNLLSDKLLKEKGHYVQAINYPTVARGQEKLRLAPTPFHTPDLMDVLVEDMLDVWKEIGLPLRGNMSKKECRLCNQPVFFEGYDIRRSSTCASEILCNLQNCPQMALNI